jgi:hypothetical protein
VVQQLTRLIRRIRHAGWLLPGTLTGYLWLKGSHPHLPGWSCPLRAITGVPCPTCFLTRATELALRGDLGGAVEHHPLGPIAAAALVLWSGLALHQRQLLPKDLFKPRLLGAGAGLLMAVWLARLPELTQLKPG